MMKLKLLYACLSLCCLTLLPAVSVAQNHNRVDALLRDYLALQQQRIGFSGVVLVANDAQIISQQAIGFASRELNIPLSGNSKFKIASMTKSFTGLLVALATQEGKLHPDDRLEKFFPELTDAKWKQITVRQLLSHTSGMPHWNGFKDYWTTASKLSLDTEQALEEIFKMKLLFDPGARSAYSSPAYYLLATILERVYQESFEAIFEKKIKAKLPLEATGIYNEWKILPGMASGYHLLSDDSLVAAPFRDISAMKGGGNLYSSAPDLLAWTRSFLSGAVWDGPLTKTIFTPLTGKNMEHKDNARYGMGWSIREKSGTSPKAYHIGGGTFGYSGMAVIYPEERIYLIMLANVSFLPMDDVIWSDLEKIVFNQPFALPKLYPRPLPLSVEKLEKFSGVYTAASGMTLQILMHQNRLYAKAGNNPPFEMYASGQNEFFAKKADVSFTFTLAADGSVTGLQAKGKGRTDEFRKK
jgi:CubicO group peptidase (beta-lactamase class C family)